MTSAIALPSEAIGTEARHFLSLGDVDAGELAHMVRRAVELGQHGPDERTLDGRTVGIYFRRSSTRTRTAFTAAAQRLGAHVIAYGPDDLQLTTGESIEDTARTLSEYLDVLVARTNDDIGELRALAEAASMSVVNALSRDEHPTQAVGDLATLAEAFGGLSGVELLYIGEGNSTAAALALATAKTPGMHATFVTPEGFGLPEPLVAAACDTAAVHGALVEHHHDMDALPSRADAVYTSRWLTMGVAKSGDDWQKAFAPYRVTTDLVERVAWPGTIFMHDLPAVRGGDVDDDVLDGDRSWAWRQAHHKMTAAMVILEHCLLPPDAGEE